MLTSPPKWLHPAEGSVVEQIILCFYHATQVVHCMSTVTQNKNPFHQRLDTALIHYHCRAFPCAHHQSCLKLQCLRQRAHFICSQWVSYKLVPLFFFLCLYCTLLTAAVVLLQSEYVAIGISTRKQQCIYCIVSEMFSYPELMCK